MLVVVVRISELFLNESSEGKPSERARSDSDREGGRPFGGRLATRMDCVN